MEKIIDGHIVGLGSVREIEHPESDNIEEFTYAGISQEYVKVYEGCQVKKQVKTCAPKYP